MWGTGRKKNKKSVPPGLRSGVVQSSFANEQKLCVIDISIVSDSLNLGQVLANDENDDLVGKTMSLVSLTPELLSRVLWGIEIREVCLLWMCGDMRLCQKVMNGGIRGVTLRVTPFNYVSLFKIVSLFPSVEELFIESRCLGESLDLILTADMQFGGIKTLNLNFSNAFASFTYFDMRYSFPALQHLRISDPMGVRRSLNLSDLPRGLEALTYRPCDNLGPEMNYGPQPSLLVAGFLPQSLTSIRGGFKWPANSLDLLPSLSLLLTLDICLFGHYAPGKSDWMKYLPSSLTFVKVMPESVGFDLSSLTWVHLPPTLLHLHTYIEHNDDSIRLNSFFFGLPRSLKSLYLGISLFEFPASVLNGLPLSITETDLTIAPVTSEFASRLPRALTRLNESVHWNAIPRLPTGLKDIVVVVPESHLFLDPEHDVLISSYLRNMPFLSSLRTYHYRPSVLVSLPATLRYFYCDEQQRLTLTEDIIRLWPRGLLVASIPMASLESMSCIEYLPRGLQHLIARYPSPAISKASSISLLPPYLTSLALSVGKLDTECWPNFPASLKYIEWRTERCSEESFDAFVNCRELESMAIGVSNFYGQVSNVIPMLPKSLTEFTLQVTSWIVDIQNWSPTDFKSLPPLIKNVQIPASINVSPKIYTPYEIIPGFALPFSKTPLVIVTPTPGQSHRSERSTPWRWG